MMRDDARLVTDDELWIFGAVLATVDVQLVGTFGIDHDAIVGADAVHPFLHQRFQFEGDPAAIEACGQR